MILKCIRKCITNNCKQPQKHGFSQKLTCPLGLFGLKSFHGFNILVWWEDETYCLSSVLFCHKNGSSILEYLYKKIYRTLPTEVKRFKSIKILQQKHAKRYIGVRWIRIVSYHYPNHFFDEEKWRNWVGEAIF